MKAFVNISRSILLTFAPLFLFLAVFPSAIFAADGDGLGERFTVDALKKLPLRRVQRPLVLPTRFFETFFDSELTRIEPGTPWLQLGLGAAYGIDKDWELGMLIVPLSFSAHPDSGISVPEFRIKRGLLRGAFEVAAAASTILPLFGEFTPTLALKTRSHFGAWMSIDLDVFARYELVEDAPVFKAGVPVELRIQILDRASLSAGLIVELIDSPAPRLFVTASASLIYTHPGKSGPFADLGLGATMPEYVFSGGMLPDPSLANHPGLTLFARFYVPEDPRYHPFEF